MAAVQQLLLEILNDLKDDELQNFQMFLRSEAFFRAKPTSVLKDPGCRRTDIVDQMVETFGQQSVEVTREVLLHINRSDLAQRLPETSSGPESKTVEAKKRNRKLALNTSHELLSKLFCLQLE